MVKRRIAAVIAIALICVAVPVMAALQGSQNNAEGNELTCLTLWQIDSFEGGKGSRAAYLTNLAKSCFNGESCYVTVTTLSSDAVRENLRCGIVPDLISYGAGFYGLEGYVNARDFAYKTWCRGGYCLITADQSADFSDVNIQNTVINSGKENLIDVAALFCGLNGAASLPPTGAYVQVLSGKYKYLLGTQRDVLRFKTRGAECKILPVTSFCDLYQNISILTKDVNDYKLCKKFVTYLTENCEGISGLGLFYDGANLHDDNLHALENLAFDYKLCGLVSEEYYLKVTDAAKKNDINLLKNLLK